MTKTATALYSFFSSFGLDAYVSGYVPDGKQPPYITYDLADPDWNGSATIDAKLWYRTTSYSAISAKVDQIANAVGEGHTIPTTSGCIMLNKDPLFCQFSVDEDETIKVAYLRFILHAFN